MYNETKVLFVLWLWHPRSQGAPYCYAALLAPLLQRHEPEIDRRLAEAQETVGSTASEYAAGVSGWVRQRFVSVVRSLPQEGAQGGSKAGGGGYVPRTASEAAAMAYMQR
jgi:receptor expression-enhancing protein 1/2/3/4